MLGLQWGPWRRNACFHHFASILLFLEMFASCRDWMLLYKIHIRNWIYQFIPLSLWVVWVLFTFPCFCRTWTNVHEVPVLELSEESCMSFRAFRYLEEIGFSLTIPMKKFDEDRFLEYNVVHFPLCLVESIHRSRSRSSFVFFCQEVRGIRTESFLHRISSLPADYLHCSRMLHCRGVCRFAGSVIAPFPIHRTESEKTCTSASCIFVNSQS